MSNSLNTYIAKLWFGSVGCYGISTIVSYLMPYPFYTSILNIYDYGISNIVGNLMSNPLYTCISNILDL